MKRESLTHLITFVAIVAAVAALFGAGNPGTSNAGPAAHGPAGIQIQILIQLGASPIVAPVRIVCRTAFRAHRTLIVAKVLCRSMVCVAKNAFKVLKRALSSGHETARTGDMTRGTPAC